MAERPGERSRREVPASAYARRIERMWAERLERALVLSPRDWSLISDWHERGIPLEVVREAMDAAVERARRKGGAFPPQRLSYLAASIDETWSALVEGRVDRSTTPPEPASARGPELWRTCADRQGKGSRLTTFLLVLLERAAAGESIDVLDDALEGRLAELAPTGLLREIDIEVDRRLRPHGDRMSAARLEETRRRARVEGLRRALGLPRLGRA